MKDFRSINIVYSFAFVSGHDFLLSTDAEMLKKIPENSYVILDFRFAVDSVKTETNPYNKE